MLEIKDDNYIVIQGWMRTKYGLTGNKLIVFAAVYGFSQDGVNEYSGSQKWLAEFVGITQRCLQKVLTELIEDGLIVKIERNEKLGTTNGYKAKRPIEEGGEKNSSPPEDEGAKKIRPGDENNSWGERTNFAHINNIINNITESKKEITKEYLSKMSDEELNESYEALCNSVSSTPEGMESILDECYLYAEEFARRFEFNSPEVVMNSKTEFTKDKLSSSKSKYPSYDEILTSYGFEPCVIARMKEFIKHCYAGRQFVSNERLGLLCDKLVDVAELHRGEDAESIGFRQVNIINRAISGGYYDFLVK